VCYSDVYERQGHGAGAHIACMEHAKWLLASYPRMKFLVLVKTDFAGLDASATAEAP
jgi:hypothetical protein